MPFDPCGMVMGYGRSCYETDLQPWRNGGPLVKIRWYRAAPGAKVFPHAHIFRSLVWEPDPWNVQVPAEIYESPRKWVNGQTPPTAHGQNFVGEAQDFLLGAVYSPLLPIHERDPWGLMIECTRFVEGPGGGDLDGGGVEDPVLVGGGDLDGGGVEDLPALIGGGDLDGGGALDGCVGLVTLCTPAFMPHVMITEIVGTDGFVFLSGIVAINRKVPHTQWQWQQAFGAAFLFVEFGCLDGEWSAVFSVPGHGATDRIPVVWGVRPYISDPIVLTYPIGSPSGDLAFIFREATNCDYWPQGGGDLDGGEVVDTDAVRGGDLDGGGVADVPEIGGGDLDGGGTDDAELVGGGDLDGGGTDDLPSVIGGDLDGGGTDDAELVGGGDLDGGGTDDAELVGGGDLDGGLTVTDPIVDDCFSIPNSSGIFGELIDVSGCSALAGDYPMGFIDHATGWVFIGIVAGHALLIRMFCDELEVPPTFKVQVGDETHSEILLIGSSTVSPFEINAGTFGPGYAGCSGTFRIRIHN